MVVSSFLKEVVVPWKRGVEILPSFIFMKNIQNKVSVVFKEMFGRTPLKLRLDDILGEAIELHRSIDYKNRREEAGDLMASLLQLMNEENWDAEEVLNECLEKIQGRKLQYRSLGRKKTICLLGGAMNPITLGHVQAAQFILNTSKTFDEVWFLPAQKHMYNKQMLSAKHRLEMCELAVQVDGRIKVFDYEIKNKLSGETYNTIVRLQDEDFAKDQYDFSFAIGLDNANHFDKWVNYELLEKLIRFVVVPRKGIKRDESVNWYLKSPHIYLENENSSIIEVSSSEIRMRIEKGKSCKHLLDPKVLEYIKLHKLYGA